MRQHRKLHNQFAHRSATKLNDLFKILGLKAVAPKNLHRFEYIFLVCELCQKIRGGSQRYSVTLRAENIRFNETVYIDFMYIERASEPHIIYDATLFNVA